MTVPPKGEVHKQSRTTASAKNGRCDRTSMVIPDKSEILLVFVIDWSKGNDQGMPCSVLSNQPVSFHVSPSTLVKPPNDTANAILSWFNTVDPSLAMLCQRCAFLFTFDDPSTKGQFLLAREMAKRAPHYSLDDELDDKYNKSNK